MKTTFGDEFWRTVKQGPRLFFAPLVWAIRGTRIEWRRVERENARRDAQELAQARPDHRD